MKRNALSRELNIRSTVFLIALLDALSLTLIIPIMPLYAARLGGDPVAIGMILAAYPLTQMLGAPVMGALSDRYGRRPILLLSLFGSFAGYIFMALAQSLPMLILARMIDGLSGGNLAVAHAILADTSPREERSRVFGMVIGSAFGLGFIIGPLITIAILLTLGDAYGVVALVAACYSLIALGVAWKTLPETKASGTIPSAPALEMARIERPALIVLLLVCLGLQQFAFGGFERLLGLFNVTHLGIGAAGTGYIFIYIGLIVVWVQARGIRKFVSRLGERHLAVVGFLLLISGLVMISMTPAQPSPWFDRAALQQAISGNTSALALPTANTLQITLPSGNPGWSGFLWLLASLLPLATGGAILRPVINSLLSQNVPIERVGGVLGISSATISAANALAPLIGGVLFVKSPTLPFLVFSATATIGLAVLLVSILSMQKDVGRMSLSSPGR